AQLERAIVNISAEIELIANATADALHHLNQKVESLQKVVLQNRIALDIMMAHTGGVCT
ncbi:ERVV1 protein, partial [Chunga burmeisteri]|nr:ERVV1 protein [Chunga burmeisteri]